MRRAARSVSTCTCRSYAPLTSSRARADGSSCRAGKQRLLFRYRRRPSYVEARDRLHPPRLALRTLGLRPHDRLVRGVEDQIAARADLQEDPAGLPHVEEDTLLDRHLVRTR